MAKLKTRFVCQNCGTVYASWMGRCSDCGLWNTLVEEKIEDSSPKKSSTSLFSNKAIALNEISYQNYDRSPSGFEELDIVLGGGIVDGSLVLVGGDPGIGKSTLLLQVALNLSSTKKVLYVSGEESPSQIKLRADRIEKDNKEVLILSENEISSVLAGVREIKPDFLIIDSIQTMHDEEISSAQGSVSQVKEITTKLMQLAKNENIVVFIIGHVTKSGAIAGPKVLEHMVDTVLYFEGEKNSPYRLIRAVKNRFGSTNELGIFEMRDRGLIAVKNPSELFIAKRPVGEAGSAIVVNMEGSRPLLIEIQALSALTSFPAPRRIALGLDYNRLNLLLAVMEKKLSISMGSFDVYINIVGGVTISETALDLALISAIISSYRNKPIREGLVIFGEVGLAGEIRQVSDVKKRIVEAEKLGFREVILPKSSLDGSEFRIKLHEVEKLTDVLDLLF